MKFLHSNCWGRLRLKAIGGRLLLIALPLVSGTPLFAQTPNADATVSFARNSISGTARTAGSGGAFSSVGADLGSLDLNPAGLGIYRSSEISITPAIRIIGDNTTYDGTSTPTNTRQISFQLPQGGFAWTKLYANATNKGDMGFDSHPLHSITFAINFSTNNFFGRNQSFGGYNSNHTLVDNYTQISNYYGTNLWSVRSADV